MSTGQGARDAARCVVRLGLTVVGVVLLLPPGAGAQDDPGASRVGPGQNVVDSAALVARAREAQARFEALRRDHLHLGSRRPSGPCDRRIGQLCWRYQPVLLWEPRGSAPVVWVARDSLLAELSRIGRRLPGDGWILGQRVRYLLEAGRVDEALVTVRQCTGAVDWCRSLEGLVLHRLGHYAEARTAFEPALAAMAPEEAGRWLDPSMLLDGEARARLDEAVGPARDSLVREVWRLADPLLLVAGNDRLTGHLARQTAVRIRTGTATPFDLPWNEDMAELLVRYGWERGWERYMPAQGERPPMPRVVQYEHPDIRPFLPTGKLLAAPHESRPGAWTRPMSGLEPAGYAPAYAPVLLPMDARTLVFTRGDRSLVATTFRLPADTTVRTRLELRRPDPLPRAFWGAPAQAGLFLDGAGGEMVLAATRDSATRGVLVLDAPAGHYRVSVEALDPGRRAGVYRAGLGVPRVPPDRVVLSPLIPVPGGSAPETTVEALYRMVPGDTLRADRLIVGWEVWGAGGAGSFRYRLALEPVSRGLLKRIGGLLGLGEPPPRLEWEEPGPEEPGADFRAIALDLSGVDPGEWTLRLELRRPGLPPLVSERRLWVAEAGPDPDAPEGGGS